MSNLLGGITRRPLLVVCGGGGAASTWTGGCWSGGSRGGCSTSGSAGRAGADWARGGLLGGSHPRSSSGSSHGFGSGRRLPTFRRMSDLLLDTTYERSLSRFLIVPSRCRSMTHTRRPLAVLVVLGCGDGCRRCLLDHPCVKSHVDGNGPDRASAARAVLGCSALWNGTGDPSAAE